MSLVALKIDWQKGVFWGVHTADQSLCRGIITVRIWAAMKSSRSSQRRAHMASEPFIITVAVSTMTEISDLFFKGTYGDSAHP